MNRRILAWIGFFAIPAATTLASWWRPEPPATGAELGRRVYIAEGCIHCHSQYVRPGTADEERWGNARDPEFSRTAAPALIGNRRQGPDLMNVGLRLTREWHRAHLRDPRRVAPASRMPSYAYLFAADDPRGEALLDYLASLGRETIEAKAGISSAPAAIQPVGDRAGGADPIPPTEGDH